MARSAVKLLTVRGTGQVIGNFGWSHAMVSVSRKRAGRTRPDVCTGGTRVVHGTRTYLTREVHETGTVLPTALNLLYLHCQVLLSGDV